MGDGIEVNAALSVLCSSNQARHPLLLTSSKTWVGHAEPAAGINGVLHAAGMLTHHAQPPLLHLRTLSPHITQAMTGRAQSIAPRQLGPLSVGATHVGVSSFGFSGSNTHAILSSPGDGVLEPAAAGVWHHQPMWCVPMLGRWGMACTAASPESLVLRGWLPVESMAALTDAPLHAYGCVWADAVMDAVRACSDTTSVALVNVCCTQPLLRPHFAIDVDLVAGAVSVTVEGQVVMRAMLTVVDREKSTTGPSPLLAMCATSRAHTSMLQPTNHYPSVAACQMMALHGQIALSALFHGTPSDAPTTLAALPNVCVAGSLQVQAKRSASIDPTPLVHVLAVQAAAPAGVTMCGTALRHKGINSSTGDVVVAKSMFEIPRGNLPAALALLQSATGQPMDVACAPAETRAVHGLLACAAVEHHLLVETRTVDNQLRVRIPPATNPSLPLSLPRVASVQCVARLAVEARWQSTPLLDVKTAYITGASGHVGGLVATWLTRDDKIDTNLVLASRTHSNLDTSLARLSMRTWGAVVHTTSHVGMAADWWLPEVAPVDMVVHAAGVLDDATLGNVRACQLRGVAASKTAAVQCVEGLARQLPMQRVALMSSVAALLGSPGQVLLGILLLHIQHSTLIRLHMLRSTVNWTQRARACSASAPHARRCSWAPWREAAWRPTPRLPVLSDLASSSWNQQQGWTPLDACSRQPHPQRWPPCSTATGLSTRAPSLGCQTHPWCRRCSTSRTRWINLPTRQQRRPSLSIPRHPSPHPFALRSRLPWGSPSRTTSRLATLVCCCMLCLFPCTHVNTGLDSLGSVEVCATLARVIQRHVPPTVLYDYPTVTVLHKCIDHTLTTPLTVAGCQPGSTRRPEPSPCPADPTHRAPSHRLHHSIRGQRRPWQCPHRPGPPGPSLPLEPRRRIPSAFCGHAGRPAARGL